MISYYGISIMGCLFISDIIYTYALKNHGFLGSGKKNGAFYALPRLFILILLPYWGGTYLMGQKSFVIQLLISFALSAGLMGLEFFLKDKESKDNGFLFLPALFALSVIVLFFINGYDFPHTVKKQLIYSLSGFFLGAVSVLAYSAVKSKVSTFRYGTVLTVIASAVSSLVFGVVSGVIVFTCLG